MPVVVLAGGVDSSGPPEACARSNSMIEIGGRPILWHAMKHLEHHGQDDFYIACDDMDESVKRFFWNQYNLAGNLSIDFGRKILKRDEATTESWKVNLIDTGTGTMTHTRLLRLKEHLESGTFVVTYGNVISDVSVNALLDFHHSHGRLATVTAVQAASQLGGLMINGDLVSRMTHPVSSEGWNSGGYFVFEPEIFEYLDSDAYSDLEACSLESDLLGRVSTMSQLAAFRHTGFWHRLDSRDDQQHLQRRWERGEAPWQSSHRLAPRPRLHVVSESTRRAA